MAKTVCKLLGVLFLLVGILGFAVPDLMGSHLSVTHSIIHLASGALAAYIGWRGSLRSARTFAIVFGAVYFLLGVAGFAAGSPGMPHPGVPGPQDERLLRVIPGSLELGTMDHILHLLLGGIFLLGGLTTRTARERREDRQEHARARGGRPVEQRRG